MVHNNHTKWTNKDDKNDNPFRSRKTNVLFNSNTRSDVKQHSATKSDHDGLSQRRSILQKNKLSNNRHAYFTTYITKTI